MDPNSTNISPLQPVAAEMPVKKKIDKKILIIIGVVAALILAVLTAVFLITKNKKEASLGEVVWWGLWEDAASVTPVIAEFESQNPGVTVKYIPQSKEDYRERLVNALAKGTGPDIFRFHNSWVAMLKGELDKIPASVYSASEFAQTFYPVATSDLTVDAGIAGIPLEYDGLALYINEDIFEKNGKNPPSSWNELRQLAKELTVKNEEGTITQSGVALGRSENVDHWQEILALMMLQNGASLSNPQGKLAEDAISFYTAFSKTDGVWDETLPSSTVSFSSGKLAMYFAPSWRSFEIKLQNPGLRFKTVPVPQLPKLSEDEPDISYASYWVEGVWSRSKSKETAWKFLKYLTQTEVLEKLYQNASKVRMFGEPYPRVDMAGLLTQHPIVGSIVSQAGFAQSWYLQSRTFDGPTGINSQISSYYEDGINAINNGEDAEDVVMTISSGVSQVLSSYGIRAQ